MSPTAIIGEHLDRLRQMRGTSELSILETGSIRATGVEYETNDGWSTLAFARQAAEHGGRLMSIDLDVSAARTVLDRHGLLDAVELVQGYSINVLAGLLVAGTETFDVAYLDSDNDPGLILHEYMLACRLVRTPGIIMVDDVDMESTGVVKGHALVPWLDQHGVPYRIERRRGTTYTTGVLIIDV